MTSIIPNIQVTDIPAQEAKPFKAVGVVSAEPVQKEIANGYVQITVPLTYTSELTGKESNFTARWNVRPEWFTPEYSARIKSGEITGSEKIQYDINMSGLTRGLFKGAGLDSIDFSQLQGRQVGFKTKARKDDPSFLDVSYFFTPKQ